MGLLRVAYAMGDPGRFRLGRAFRKIGRGIGRGIRGLAPIASLVPGGGYITRAAELLGDAPGSKGGTHAHPSKHGTPHPHAKPSHAHARHQSSGRLKALGKGAGNILAGVGSAVAGRIGADPSIVEEHVKSILGGGAGHPALHGMRIGGHRRVNYMNIKAARRAGRRVKGALRLLESLKKSLPHVRHGKVVHVKKRGR